MNIKYDGTTWAVSDADLPDHIKRSLEQPGDFRRTWAGAGRLYNRYSKWVWPLSWSMIGTDVQDRVSTFGTYDGTVALEYSAGTFNTYVEPGSYDEQEVSYQAWDVSVTLKEI